jgi:hypothetical protein
MDSKLIVQRNYPWERGGPDLALCTPDGSPLPKTRAIAFESFAAQGGSQDTGLLTVTFVVDGNNIRFAGPDGL